MQPIDTRLIYNYVYCTNIGTELSQRIIYQIGYDIIEYSIEIRIIIFTIQTTRANILQVVWRIQTENRP